MYKKISWKKTRELEETNKIVKNLNKNAAIKSNRILNNTRFFGTI
jgi:hypothetical protein